MSWGADALGVLPRAGPVLVGEVGGGPGFEEQGDQVVAAAGLRNGLPEGRVPVLVSGVDRSADIVQHPCDIGRKWSKFKPSQWAR